MVWLLSIKLVPCPAHRNRGNHSIQVIAFRSWF